MEVIYTGIFQTPETIVTAVLQEDADVLGLSILSGAHMHYAEEVLALFKKHGLSDVLFLLGGTIPKQDAARLREMGVEGVFGPGTHTGEIVAFIQRWAAEQRPV
jgi:methylmalonyl-CoA mutase C-terminal domain/subunit